MSTLLIILTVVFLFSLACGAVMWLFLRSRRAARPDQPTAKTAAEAPVFRWRYIALPMVVLILTAAMVGYFYRLLPPEVAYHFRSDGSPDQWLNRSTIVLWALLPQFFLTILAGAVTWGLTTLSSLSIEVAAIIAKLGRLLLVMGNMVVIPQVILCFAMLDIFSYNSYQVHILPLWVFALIVMAVGAIVLTVFFFQTIRQTWVTPR
ncbi:MAG: DUF1648 domain-containing protein [Dehalococcoidia bacterium]|nr:DUF1648 domain-containing protein [Dehalococcoidia bacterium]MBL7166293.1 DUF1648 domain-containing protein [Dehalococcoidales bacterium]